MWDDLEPGETIKIYDKGITVKKVKIKSEIACSCIIGLQICMPPG